MAQGPLAGALAALLALPASCDLPRDPEGTREEVEGATLRVAVVAPALTPQEEAAVAALAESLGAAPEILRVDLHAGVDELRHGRIHLIVGGIPTDTPHSQEAATSSPIGRERYVLLLRQGENAMLLAANRAVAAAEEAAR